MGFSVSDFLPQSTIAALGASVDARPIDRQFEYGTRAVRHSARRFHCEKKRAFPTREAAEKHQADIIRMQLGDADGLRVYECE